MKLYVGYVLNDYADAIYMGRNKELVKKKTKEISFGRTYWVEEVTLPKENSIYEFDCD